MKTKELNISHEQNDVCLPLIEASNLHIYCDNPFRITGLAVDASAKEIKKHAEKLKMMEELGYGEGANPAAFALTPPPTVDKIRSAMQRLNEPENRLLDEFFWFWPLEFGKSGSDPAILAMLAGDSDTAYDIWQRLETNSALSYVAEHNIAVMFHLIALDWTIYHLAADIDSTRENKIRHYWEQANLRWEKLADDERIWDAVKARIRSMNDARLTTGFALRMRACLPEALAKINAHAALRFAEEKGRFDVAKMHIEFMSNTHPGHAHTEKATEIVLRPITSRIQQQIQTSKENAKTKPKSGAETASQLMVHCCRYLDIFDIFYGKTAHQKTELFDEVAEASVDCLVAFLKNTENNNRFLELLRQTNTFATGADIRSRILKNIEAGESNLRYKALEPFLKKLDSIRQSKESAAFQFAKVKKHVMPSLETLAQQDGSTNAQSKELSNSIALALRSISVKAHNEEKDYSTALAAIRIAAKLANDSELMTHIDEDMPILEEHLRESTCYFCSSSAAKEGSEKKVNMYGNVMKIGSTVHYTHRVVPVPRCSTCKSTDIKHILISGGAWCGCIGIAMGYCEMSSPGTYPTGFFFGLFCGFPASWITKSFLSFIAKIPSHKKYYRVKALRSTGWSFGSKPGRYG